MKTLLVVIACIIIFLLLAFVGLFFLIKYAYKDAMRMESLTKAEFYHRMDLIKEEMQRKKQDKKAFKIFKNCHKWKRLSD